ncbi:MAG: transporter, ATP-binding protein, partial [Herbinix sp.]|nr:transporter, ATP-binding protein [Herbinix sp.]
KIPMGQRLAIVGHNGAGKTTFVKLLCRLYDVTEGEILLNGINIKCYNKEEYLRLFSAVFQEVKILAFSAGENVALTEKENIDTDRLHQALEQAGVADKIASLANGTNTSLLKFLDDEGVELSGGENQKISIARALYKDGPIMVLDEPTAALDALAEYQTYMNFNQMVGQKTAIYISHRLASTIFCDTIAMFEQGEIIEYGSHAELLAKQGKYWDMFETQAKYYKEEAIA